MALYLVESGMDDYAAAVITERVRQKRLAVTVDCHSKTEIVRHSPVKPMLCNNKKYPSTQHTTFDSDQNGKCPS